MDELINPNPVLHARRRTARRSAGGASTGAGAAGGREPIDALEVFEHLRDITDPEHPYTLEQLNVLEEDNIDVDDAAGAVRCASGGALRARARALRATRHRPCGALCAAQDPMPPALDTTRSSLLRLTLAPLPAPGPRPPASASRRRWSTAAWRRSSASASASSCCAACRRDSRLT
jgi:hypothetical protein